MAYIKKKDRMLNELKDYIKNNGSNMTLEGIDGKKQYTVWNAWPICVQDICVDYIGLCEDNVYGFDMDGKKIGRFRNIGELHQRYVESILHDVKEGYKKKK